MKHLFVLLLLVAQFGTAQAGPKSSSTEAMAKKFGSEIETKKVLALADVIANYDDHKGKMVTFEATAKKVCEKKGCWMVLKDGDHEVRTLFKDYGFFVPPSIVGKRVRVQGTMEQKKVSAATIRHFMKDEGKKMQDIKKVKTGQIKFQFVADAVEII